MITLQQARHECAMSVSDLSERAGVSLATVYRIERGATRPRPYVARRLASALHVDAAEVRELQPTIKAVQLPAPTIVAA